MHRLRIITTVLSAVTAWPALADSYMEFANFRSADATGRYYLVVKKLPGNPEDPGRGTSVEFTYAECKPASPPLKDVEDERFGIRQVRPNPEVRVREGDKVLGAGRLERSPGQILISSTGLGFVGLDVRGYNFGTVDSRDAVVVVAKDGAIRHRKSLIDLFTFPELEAFDHTAGGISWLGDGWIDEKRREAVVVGIRSWHDEDEEGKPKPPQPRVIRIVNMETGAVRKGSEAEIVTVLAERNRGGLDGALDLVAEQKIAAAKKHLPRHFDDAQLPIETRLRAAVALATFGDRRGGTMMSKAALDGGPGLEYAIDHLVDILGDDAAPVLCEAVKKHGEAASHFAWSAMQRVSAKAAVPPLVRLLSDWSKPQGLNFAADCLGGKKAAAKGAVPHLIRVLKERPPTDNPELTVLHAVWALKKIGPEAKEAIPNLRRIEQLGRDRLAKLNADDYKPPENMWKDQLWQSETMIEDSASAIRAIEGKE